MATSEDAWTPTMGVPHESSGRNITSNVTHEIIEFDSKKVYLDYDVYPCGKSQTTKKKKISQDRRDKVAKSKGKVGTRTTMRNTFEH